MEWKHYSAFDLVDMFVIIIDEFFNMIYLSFDREENCRVSLMSFYFVSYLDCSSMKFSLVLCMDYALISKVIRGQLLLCVPWS